MKYIDTSRWCISDNGEFFTDGYDSREEAIEEVRKEYGCGYIGRKVHMEFIERDIIIPDIKGELSDKLSDAVSREASDNWYISKELRKKFARKYEKFVIDFINDNGLQPTCFRVVDIEEVKEREQE